MKIALRLPNGAVFDFEGDAAEFELMSRFLAEPPTSLSSPSTSPNEEGEAEAEREKVADGTPLDPRSIQARLDQVGATTDMQRVTVLAQLAVEAGEEGATYELLDAMYTQLGLRKPSRHTRSVANAKQAGMIRTVRYGRWKPTVKGENFARGLDMPGRRPTRPAQRQDTGGEDEDG